MNLKVFILFLLFNSILYAQDKLFNQQQITINRHIDGTFLLPNKIDKPNLAIIIAGSGPTDRDGNQNLLKNNSLKKLAERLSENDIATFRYDKRIVKQMRQGNIDYNISFNDFIADAISVINFFKTKDDFNKIYIIGHSQGSLVGMIAAKEGADGYISVAGAGKPIDEVIIDQINNTAPMFNEDTKRVFSVLKEGKVTDDYPIALATIFNKEVQPFMMSWMKYNPQLELKKIDIPILIINGTKDLQVSVEEANLLKASVENAQIEIIEKMNHILVPIEGGNLENSKSYNESFRKISPILTDIIVNFIK